MKCVPKINCNFNGVMVEQQVVLNDVQERQRVHLIPCVSPLRTNAIDVCCRDPNYKDPWPENVKVSNGQFVNGNNGQVSNFNNGQFINGNNGQFNPIQQKNVQGSEFVQEQIKTDVKINIPKKRKTHGYGK